MTDGPRNAADARVVSSAVPRLRPVLTALVVLLALPAGAIAAPRATFDAHASAFARSRAQIPVATTAPPAGAQELRYRFGPMTIAPGQNTINIDLQKERPAVDGWIVGFRPGLVYADGGRSPSVRIVHLHHAVWLSGESLLGAMRPTFAAGEEKTYVTAPSGFGWRYTTKQAWVLNHMIHNLTASPRKVYLTYTLWFIPDGTPQATGMTAVHTQWLDVQGIKPYPVFDARRGQGTAGRFTYPDQARDPYPDGVVRNRWVADHDGTMIQTAGHLHPGGLWTDLSITRGAVTKRIFRSRANYFEPAGPVSWDVAMSATTDRWRVDFKRGDVISTSATYDTSRASWYEVMGIMPVAVTDAPVAGGVDPFAPGAAIDQTDVLTHPRLPENLDGPTDKVNRAYRDARRSRPGPYRDRITIENFLYSQGDLTMPGRAGLPPRVRQGRSLTFVNRDAPLTERFHTITACREPCNRRSGIGFPLANGRVGFDSGELGFGPTISTATYAPGEGSGQVPITPVVDTPAPRARCAGVAGLAKVLAGGCIGTTTWRTPKTLRPGTYTYFCRIHPFMRGAFRVVQRRA